MHADRAKQGDGARRPELAGLERQLARIQTLAQGGNVTAAVRLGGVGACLAFDGATDAASRTLMTYRRS